MKTGFKQTPIGKIPEDWEPVKLQSIIEEPQNGIWGEEPQKGDKVYPVIRSTEITHDGRLNLSTVALRKIPDNKVEKYRLVDGDILLVGSSGSSHLIGRAALFEQPDDGKKYLFSNFMVRVKVEKNEVSPKLLYYFLTSAPYLRSLKTFQQTSTGLRNLPKQQFLRIELRRPPMPEQEAIAEVLSTVDEAIQKVDEIIAKTERLKRGLMQELLTKGIGHKEFKDTEIGRIPKEWDVVSLKDVGENKEAIIAGPFGSNLKVSDYRPKGIPIIRLQNIERNKFINKNIKHISPEKARDLGYHSYNVGDLVLAKLGDPIGKTCIVPDSIEKGIVVADVVRIRPSQKRVNTRFLEYILNSSICLNQLRKETIGSTRPRVNISQVRNLRILRPPISEQQKIASILSTVDKKLELERKRKEKLERIKKGLMNDLLTGKKRVKIKRS